MSFVGFCALRWDRQLRLNSKAELSVELGFATTEQMAATIALIGEVKRMLSRLIVAVRKREQKSAKGV